MALDTARAPPDTALPPSPPSPHPDYTLRAATSRSLVRRQHDKLVSLCRERGIRLEGESGLWRKKAMAEALLNWRALRAAEEERIVDALPPDAPDSDVTLAPHTLPRMVSRVFESMDADDADVAGALVPLPESRLQHPPDLPLLSRATTNASERPSTPPEDISTEPSVLDLAALGMESAKIDRRELHKLMECGRGGFKTVYSGRYRGHRVAIAELRGQLTEADIRELTLLRGLSHPNIVRFIGVSEGPPISIVTELCRNGDLYHYLRTVEPPPVVEQLDMMLDASRGLAYLHAREPAVVHRDIKSLNVLVSSKGRAKLADFGLARVKTSANSLLRTNLGTLNWQAPELWVARPAYTNAVDIYALALTLWEITTWPQPEFPCQTLTNEHDCFQQVGKQRVRPQLGAARRLFGRPFASLLERMWAHNSNLRPNIIAVVSQLETIRDSAAREVETVARLQSAMNVTSV